MKNEEKAKAFFEMKDIESFEAQVALENETFAALQAKFMTIEADSSAVFEFAEIRGALKAIRQIQSVREKLIEDHRSRLRH